ncbi:hypothetical protein F5Y05DRAFT_396102 [Hypoxylon sp. FL0543]|nr:hypothetical protein F5Y05DRAFT_396102 [Hypoxylon sp. FL0543]
MSKLLTTRGSFTTLCGCDCLIAFTVLVLEIHIFPFTRTPYHTTRLSSTLPGCPFYFYNRFHHTSSFRPFPRNESSHCCCYIPDACRPRVASPRIRFAHARDGSSTLDTQEHALSAINMRTKAPFGSTSCLRRSVHGIQKYGLLFFLGFFFLFATD